MGSPPQVPHLRVRTDVTSVDPFLLAPAIRTVLAGGEWPVGPERDVADAVVAAVHRALGGLDDGERPWR